MAIQRCRKDTPGPGQVLARTIINGSLMLASNIYGVMLRWVPAHQGMEENEVVDCWAKEAAQGDGEGTRSEGAEASLAFLKRTTKEEKKRKTQEWIKEKIKGSRAYILKEKEGIRKHLRSERKETAARYYRLMTGYSVIAPYLKNKLKKRDSEEY
jgi:hypothetical protein